MLRDCVEPDCCKFEEVRRVAVTAADKERGHGVDVRVEWQRVYNAGACHNASCGPAREPEIPRHLTFCISKRWLRLSP
jgi:hypothetical protein